MLEQQQSRLSITRYREISAGDSDRASIGHLLIDSPAVVTLKTPAGRRRMLELSKAIEAPPPVRRASVLISDDITSMSARSAVLHAAVIDLDFELFPKDKTSFKNLVSILDRYLLVADEERKRHPGQKDLCLVLLGHPAIIEQVETLKRQHSERLLVFGASIPEAGGAQSVLLYVALQARDAAADMGRRESYRTGTVTEAEMRKDFQRLRKPDRV